MNAEKKIEEQVAAYVDLARSNKNIDVAVLMANVLEQQRRDEVDAKRKRRAYLVSILVPPFGLIYAVRYYFSDKTDGRRVALICVILTVVVLAATWAFGMMIMNSTPITGLDQIEQINIEDIRSLLE